jgi:hypothetical protein
MTAFAAPEMPAIRIFWRRSSRRSAVFEAGVVADREKLLAAGSRAACFHS